jgi:Cdc6-like AAA superfamily ATPase
MLELTAEVVRFTGVVESVLSAETMEKIREVLDLQEETRDEVRLVARAVHKAHEDFKTKIDSLFRTQEYREVLSAFGMRAAFQRHDQSRHLRLESSGLWFIQGEDFNNWLQTPHSALWLRGIPGAGKTVLASTLTDETRKRMRLSAGTSAMAFHYCDHKDEESQHPENILGTLAAQLAAQDEQSFAILREHYETHLGPGRIQGATGAPPSISET